MANNIVISTGSGGSGGGVSLGLGEWEFENSTGTPPDDKSFRINNASVTSATKLYIDYTNDDGADLTNIFSLIGEGSVLYFQEIDDANRAAFFRATGATDAGNYLDIDVTDGEEVGAGLQDGKKYALIIATVGGGAAQNLWETVQGDSGSTSASSPTDILTVAGGTDISTTMSGSTLTVDFTGTAPAAPNILSRHNGAATQTFGGTAVTILFGTNVRDDSNYTYNAGEVTINTTGTYRVSFNVTADSSGPRTSASYYLENNTSEVAGTRAWSYHRNTSQGEDTAVANFIISLTASDVIRVRGTATSNVTTKADACRIILEFIE